MVTLTRPMKRNERGKKKEAWDAWQGSAWDWVWGKLQFHFLPSMGHLLRRLIGGPGWGLAGDYHLYSHWRIYWSDIEPGYIPSTCTIVMSPFKCWIFVTFSTNQKERLPLPKLLPGRQDGFSSRDGGSCRSCPNRREFADIVQNGEMKCSGWREVK